MSMSSDSTDARVHYVYAYAYRKQKKKTTLLAHKYFCEQDVGNDKHSSWLLNRSARQCVVRSACACFSELCVCVCVCGSGLGGSEGS